MKMAERAYEILDEKDKVRYALKIQGTREISIKYRRYPLLPKGWNYEEVNINLKRWRGHMKVEVYLIRQNWNGTGYVHLCEEKLKIDDDIFNIDVSNVKDAVVKLLKQLRPPLENSQECSDAVMLYFPEGE